MSEQFVNQLFIYVRVRSLDGNEADTFILEHRHILKDMRGFEKFSMQFHFKLPINGADQSSLIFAKKEKIFEFNYHTAEVRDVYVYENPLNQQP